MFIMTFNNKTEIVSALTSDRRQLANSIFGLHADGSTALYDAVDSALDYVKQGQHRKKVLVVVTDGADNKSRIRFSRLVEKVKESDVLIYTVGMYGGMAQNPTEARLMAEPQNQLRQLAEITGAYAHFPQDADKCREVMADDCAGSQRTLHDRLLPNEPEPRRPVAKDQSCGRRAAKREICRPFAYRLLCTRSRRGKSGSSE